MEVNVASPLQSSVIMNEPEKTNFALSANEDRKCEHNAQKLNEVGIQFIPVAFDSFGIFSETIRMTLKWIAILADNRSFQPPGMLLIFSKCD